MAGLLDIPMRAMIDLGLYPGYISIGTMLGGEKHVTSILLRTINTVYQNDSKCVMLKEAAAFSESVIIICTNWAHETIPIRKVAPPSDGRISL